MQPTATRVPLRLDLSGGTLDIWPLHLALPEPAVTVNVALEVPAEVEIAPLDGSGIHLASVDQGLEASYDTPALLEEALAARLCPLALLGHAALAAAPEGGYALTTTATSPKGAGLGGSSALLVAVIGGLLEARGERAPLEAIRQLAQDVETALLRTPTGYQDYYPPLHGGLLALEGAVGGIVVEPLGVDLAQLEGRLRLLYTGEPHESGLTNWGVVRAYLDGEAHTVDALHRLADISRAQREAFRASDLDAALALVVEDGAVRRQMAPGVATPTIDALDEGARAAGALGTKICGAGGGGCVMVVLPDDAAVAAAVDAWIPGCGADQLPARLVPEGLTYRNR
ncbi:MAG: hypothetical protein QNJ98_18870 [Planctomycetota bacterium]|nr:hypothetical protein [Planctomycetota bacterium]